MNKNSNITIEKIEDIEQWYLKNKSPIILYFTKNEDDKIMEYCCLVDFYRPKEELNKLKNISSQNNFREFYIKNC